MAIWTNPTTRTTRERITQAIWNVDLVENLKYLYDTLIAYIAGRTVTTVRVTTPVASIDFTNIPQNGGDILISGFLVPATDDVGLFFKLNNHVGGADYSYQIAGSDGATAANADAFKIVSGTTAGEGVGNAAVEGISFRITIPDYVTIVGSADRYIFGQGSFRQAGGAIRNNSAGGSLKFAEAIDRVTLLFESGNIAGGTVRLETTRT